MLAETGIKEDFVEKSYYVGYLPGIQRNCQYPLVYQNLKEPTSRNNKKCLFLPEVVKVS